MAFPKKKKKYRSPVEGSLRRLPGQCVRDERNKLLNDQLFEYFRLRTEIRNLNQAEKGERRVSELLTQLRRKRYVAFDDLLVDQSNIDHLLVGPGGIFAIETKAYNVFGNGYVGVDELGVLRLSNKPATKDPLRQATRSAANIVRILKDRMRSDFDVTPSSDFSRLGFEGCKSGNRRGCSK